MKYFKRKKDYKPNQNDEKKQLQIEDIKG